LYLLLSGHPIGTDAAQVDRNFLAQQLSVDDFSVSRGAYRTLWEAYLADPQEEEWLKWTDTALAAGPTPHGKSLLMGLRQRIRPYEVLSPHGSAPPDLDSITAEIDSATAKAFGLVVDRFEKCYKQLWGEQFLSSSTRHPDRGGLKLHVKDPRFHERTNATLQKIIESDFACGATPTYSRSNKLSEAEIQAIADHVKGTWSDLRTLLRDYLAIHTGFHFLPTLWLYSFGNPDDISFLIEHIPPTKWQRAMAYGSLSTALHRDGTIDLAAVMGYGQFPYLDWWNAEIREEEWRNRLRDWWGAEKGSFDYGRNIRGNMKPIILPEYMAGPRKTFIHAPALNGVFWIDPYDWFSRKPGTVHFFGFTTGETLNVIDQVEEFSDALSEFMARPAGVGAKGIHWNSEIHALEVAFYGKTFAIDIRDNRVASVFESEWTGPGMEEFSKLDDDLPFYQFQRNSDFVHELRGGDIYRVDEAAGTEECLVDFGYVMSFLLSADRTKAILVERDPLGLAYWLASLESK
jgi:hypothetical protein